MYLYVDTAKRKRINHPARESDFMPKDKSFYQTILPGQKCLVFCNGTIGKGRLAYNYSKEDAIEMLNELITELKVAS